MVSDAAYVTVVAENTQLRERVAHLEADQAAREERLAEVEAEHAAREQRIAQLEAALAQALERVRELEQAQAAKKGPPPFVKANVPARPPQPRKPRAPEHNQGRRRETPRRIVEHRPAQCTTCGGRLSGWTLARRRQVVEIPPPPPVEVTEHQLYRGWCSYCHRWCTHRWCTHRWCTHRWCTHRWCTARVDLRGQVLGQGRLGGE